MSQSPNNRFPNEESFLAQFKDELADMQSRNLLVLHISPVVLWAVVSQLQLAMRHPENQGPTADMARFFIGMVASDIAPPGTARAEMLRRGFAPEADPVRDWQAVHNSYANEGDAL